MKTHIYHDEPTLAGIQLERVGPGLWRLPTLSGAQSAPSPTYPLDAPTVDGTLITVDEALNNPTRITRDIAQLAQQRFFIDRIFTAAGGIDGGAILFERPNPLATDLFAEREPKPVAPGTEFPESTFARGVPMVARPIKIGTKWMIPKESVKRNDTRLMQRRMIQTANTITRRTELMGLAELDAVTASESRFTTGTSWSAYAATALISRTGTEGPVADIAAAAAFVDNEQRGHVLDSIILNTFDALSIRQAYPNTPLNTVLSDAGIGSVFVSPRQTQGRARLFESGQVGEWRNEFPLEEEVWYEQEIQSWWYQWSISPSFVVTDQFAMLELRGIS